MTVISLVRHGLVFNPDDIYYGRRSGFRLHEKGREQAAAAGRVLAAEPVAIIYHSPLQRAVETSAIIQAHLVASCPQVESAHLNEVFSRFDGFPVAEMDRRDWNIYEDVAPPYEAPRDIVARMCAFFDRARAAHPGEHIVGVSHGDPIAFAILWANDLPLTAEARKQLAVCGVPEQYPSQASIATFTFADDAAGVLTGFHYHCPYELE